MIEIVENGDLVVEVVEHDKEVVDPNGRHLARIHVTEFRVSREVLIKNSSVWRAMLTTNFNEGR